MPSQGRWRAGGPPGRPALTLVSKVIPLVQNRGKEDAWPETQSFRGAGEEVRHREGLAVRPVGARRGTGDHRRPLRAGPAHRRAQAVGTAWWRAGCSSTTRPPGRPTTATCARSLPAACSRRSDSCSRRWSWSSTATARPRMERRRAEGDIRVGRGFALRDPAQHAGTSTSTARARGRAFRVVDEPAAGAQPVRRRRLRLQHRPRLPRPVRRRARLLRRQRTSRTDSC